MCISSASYLTCAEAACSSDHLQAASGSEVWMDTAHVVHLVPIYGCSVQRHAALLQRCRVHIHARGGFLMWETALAIACYI